MNVILILWLLCLCLYWCDYKCSTLWIYSGSDHEL